MMTDRDRMVEAGSVYRCRDKSEKATLSLSEEARASLVTSKFNGRQWCLTTTVASVVAELLAAKAIQETARGIALTSTGMSMRAISSRFVHRQRSARTS